MEAFMKEHQINMIVKKKCQEMQSIIDTQNKYLEEFRNLKKIADMEKQAKIISDREKQTPTENMVADQDLMIKDLRNTIRGLEGTIAWLGQKLKDNGAGRHK